MKELVTNVRLNPIQSGSPVAFRLGDAICPQFARIALNVGPNVTVCGEVAFFSDSGQDQNRFAIIHVHGMDTPLVVPAGRLELVTSTPSDEVTPRETAGPP